MVSTVWWLSRLYLLLSALFLGYGEKKVAAAFFNGEMENELRDLGRLDMFGLMKEDSDREKVMSEIDKIRAKSVYDHPSADCCIPDNKFIFGFIIYSQKIWYYICL